MGLGYTIQNKYSSLNLTPGTGNQNRTEWTNGKEKSGRIGESVPYCLLSIPKYSTAPGWTIPTRVSVESAQDPMLDFSIVLLTEKNPNLDRVDVIE